MSFDFRQLRAGWDALARNPFLSWEDLMNPSQHRPPENERRLKVFWVAEDEVAFCVWDLLKEVESGGRRFLLPTLDGPPPDAVLMDVRHSWERKCFGFLFRHPSFPPVPDGDILPDARAAVAVREVTLPDMGGSPSDLGLSVTPPWITKELGP